MGFDYVHTWPKSHASLDLLIHLHIALMVIANGMSSVVIPGRATDGLRLLGRRGTLSSTTEGLLEIVLLETDGVMSGLRGSRTYTYAMRACCSTVERI